MNIFNQYEKRIIEILLQDEKTLPEIAKELEISKPGTSKYLKKLEKLNIIQGKYERNYTGRTIRYSLKPFHMIFSINPETKTINNIIVDDPLDTDFIFIGNIPQKEFRNEVKKYLLKISNLEFNQYMILLYGSVAQGTANRKSDIDILVLKNSWNNKEKNKFLEMFAKASQNASYQIKPLFITIKEFDNMDKTLKKEIKDNGIILYEKGNSWNKIKTQLKRYKSITI